MNLPADLKYTKEHEWIKIDGDMATIELPTLHKASWATLFMLTSTP